MSLGVRGAVYGLLILAVVVVFGQTVGHGFVDIDDQTYVCKNREVVDGLTGHGLLWALTHCYASNWHPLTWLSHMLDCQVYQLRAGGHHATNIVLHALAAILLLRFLERSTRSFWPSALVAALFAIHPLRVESVAWVAERKDVLSGLLCMLTLNLYVAYVRNSGSWLRYAAVLGAFALGLAAKPMLVTLPLVLLLVDYWPLQRWNSPTPPDEAALPRRTFPWPLLKEKIPLFLLSAASCAVTWIAQRQSMSTFTKLPLDIRLGNAAVAATAYIVQMFVPRDMAAFYPLPPPGHPAWKVTAALGILLCVSVVCGVFARKRPFLIVGWLWYLVTLLPVLGLAQVGSQARADRYTYLPQIGLYVILVWTSASWAASQPFARRIWGLAWTAVLALFVVIAWRQTSYWRNSETLWTHAIACTSDNHLAHYNLGLALQEQNRIDPAIEHFRAAIRARGDYAVAYNNLGRLLDEKGLRDQAIACYQRAIALDREMAEAENNLGNSLRQKGDLGAAAEHLNRAIELRGNYAEAYVNLALVRRQQGDDAKAAELCLAALKINPQLAPAELLLGNIAAKRDLPTAVNHFRAALQIDPRNADACFSLALTLDRQGRPKEALPLWRAGLALRPRDVLALEMTARLLATDPDPAVRNGSEAVALAQRAVQLSGGRDAVVLDTLASAYAEAGRFPEAIRTATAARDLAAAAGRWKWTAEIQQRLDLFRAGKAFREAGHTRNGPN